MTRETQFFSQNARIIAPCLLIMKALIMAGLGLDLWAITKAEMEMKGPLNNRNDIIIEVPRQSQQIFTILIIRGGEK